MAGSAWTNQVQNLLIVQTGSGATGLFVYSGTPGPGNGPVFWATSSSTDPYGNPVTPSAGVAATGQFNAGFTIINASGTFVYSGVPALGNLVASLSPAAGTDVFGNTTLAGVATYDPSGLTAQLLTGALNLASTLDTFTLAALAGTDELDLTSDNGNLTVKFAPSLMTVTGGPLQVDEALTYGGQLGTFTRTFTSSGTFTVPAGVTTLKIEAWGAGGGGASSAGAGGGGGEYAAEPASAATPGGTVTVTIGTGGALGVGGASNSGGAGGNTTTSGGGTTAVTAHGGGGGNKNGTPASSGGSGSSNTTHHSGGASGTSTGGSKGGSGGGGCGGPTGAGGAGTNSSGNTPGVGGAAGSGGSTGGGSGGGWGAALGKIPTNGGTGGYPGGGGGAGGWDGGAQQAAGGAGGKGQVKITYTITSASLIAAFAGAAGTDASSNAFAAGFTGQIQAFQPSSSPTVVETWHTMGAFNANFSHGSPVPAYKLNADDTVSLAGLVTVASGTTSGTVVTLPSGYIPISTKKWPVPISAGTPAATANVQITINTSGNIILSAGPTGAGYSFALDTIRFPLDY